MDNNNADFDPKKRTKALNLATLRAVVAAYLVYLGGSIVFDMLRGRSTLSPAFAWISGLFFVAVGLLFGLYTWRRWKADAEAARSPEQPEDRPSEE